MIDNANLEYTKNLIKKENGLKVVVAKDDSYNRKILEYGKFDVLISVEKGNRRDGIRQSDTGLNHILAKIAKNNNICIGLDLDEIKKLELKQKALRLSKIIQNIKICRKNKVNLAVKTSSYNSAKDFLLGLNASTTQLKDLKII